MIPMKSNLKGFVFTLDAIFALIVAVASVSILLYVHFSSTLLYTAPAAEASSLLQSLLQTSVLSASAGNLYASYLLNAWNGNAYAWPQFAHDQYQSSNSSYGPQAAYLLYSFKAATANAIIPIVAVDKGVAVFAAGTYLYAVNATTGSLSNTYPLISAATIPVAPVVYKNSIIYSTSTGYINAVSISNSLVQLWSRSIGTAATTPLGIENNYLVFASGNSVYLLNPANGTQLATVNLPVSSSAQPPAYVNGEFIISTGRSGTPNYIYSYVLAGGTLTNVWSYALTSSQTTRPVVNGSAIAVGSGSTVYVLDLGGSLIRQITLLNSPVTGMASSGSNLYVQTVGGIFGFSPSGNTMSFTTQTNNQNSTPSTSPPMLYTLVSGKNFQGYNIRTGLNVWNISLPSSSSYTGYSDIAIAYGNAYVPNGNTLYVFGTYGAQPNDSLMQSIAGMYLNNQGAYSSIMLNKIYNSTNTGIFINGTYAPSLKTTSFNGMSSYINLGNSASLSMTSSFTVAAWINSAVVGNSVGGTVFSRQDGTNGYEMRFEGYGDLSGKMMVDTVSGGTWYAARDENRTINKAGQWYHVVGTFNGNYLQLYINGVMTRQTAASSPSLVVANAIIGRRSSMEGSPHVWNGLIADVQIYNIALTQSQIMQLYQAGQFGMPVNSTNLVGWWPLNGDSNDYSGYYNIGIPTNVAYQSSNVLPASLRNAFQVSKATAPLSITSNGVSKLYNVSVVSWR